MIILLLCLIIVLMSLYIVIKHKKSSSYRKEQFSFWSDLSDFFSDWGKEIVCAAANDCNSCGEDGTTPCPSCSNTSFSDCMNANSSFSTSNWCRHYFNKSDPRNGIPCPDITGKNAVNNLNTPNTTGWFTAGNRVVRLNNNQYECLALKSSPSQCMDWNEYVKQMPFTTICESLQGFTVPIQADENTIDTTKQLMQLRWPAKAIRIGIFIIASYPDKLVFFPQDLYTGFEQPNSHLNSALVVQNDGTISWQQNVQNLDNDYNELFKLASTIVDMPYAFSLDQWFVFTDININNPRTLNFMYNTYKVKPASMTRNVLSIDFDTPKSDYQIKQNSNPLFVTTSQSLDKPIDLVPYMNPTKNNYNPIVLNDWIVYAQSQADINTEYLLFQHRSTQSSMQLVYYKDNDAYNIMFVNGKSQQTNFTVPSVATISIQNQQTCTQPPSPSQAPKFRRVQIPRSENAYCLQDQTNGTLTCDDCTRNKLPTSPANIC